MNPFSDYYQILGISKGANSSEIKKAYKRGLLKWHPDRNNSPEAKQTTMLIIEAWEILSNPEKKRLYDYTLHTDTTPPTEYSEELQRWQRQAQDTAKEVAKKPLKVILREVSYGIAVVTGCLVIFFGWNLMIGSVLLAFTGYVSPLWPIFIFIILCVSGYLMSWNKDRIKRERSKKVSSF